MTGHDCPSACVVMEVMIEEKVMMMVMVMVMDGDGDGHHFEK